MEPITLISGRRKIVCSNPVYYARTGDGHSEHLVPSHIVAWPQGDAGLLEISYVQLKDARVPILVDYQQDGSVWLGGAYLDVVATELRLIPCAVPDELRGKSKEWLKAVDERWQSLPPTVAPTPSRKPAPGWDGRSENAPDGKARGLWRAGKE
jgi:hypothetical protein